MIWNGKGALKIGKGRFVKQGAKLPKSFIDTLSDTRCKYFTDKGLFIEGTSKQPFTLGKGMSKRKKKKGGTEYVSTKK